MAMEDLIEMEVLMGKSSINGPTEEMGFELAIKISQSDPKWGSKMIQELLLRDVSPKSTSTQPDLTATAPVSSRCTVRRRSGRYEGETRWEQRGWNSWPATWAGTTRMRMLAPTL